MSFTIKLPLTLPVGQYPNGFKLIGLRMEPIKGRGGHWVKIVIMVDRLYTEVYQHPVHSNLFENIGGEISVKFLYHTRGNGMWRLTQCPPSLICNCFAEEVLGVVEPLFLNEQPVFGKEAQLLGRTFVDKLVMVIGTGRLFTSPPSLGGHLLVLTRL